LSIDLSIIIPALNEGISAQIMVYNINQTIGLDDYEIIIVNSGGTHTSGMEKLLNVCVYNMPRQGAPQARNFGARKRHVDISFLLIVILNLLKVGDQRF
jgi:glycosyltransferase involved in cell wall biosynthesis